MGTTKSKKTEAVTTETGAEKENAIERATSRKKRGIRVAVIRIKEEIEMMVEGRRTKIGVTRKGDDTRTKNVTKIGNVTKTTGGERIRKTTKIVVVAETTEKMTNETKNGTKDETSAKMVATIGTKVVEIERGEISTKKE